MSAVESPRHYPSHVVPWLLAGREVAASIPFSQKEMLLACRDFKRACTALRIIDRYNQTWTYNLQLVDAFKHSPDAVQQLYGEWGVFQKKDGTLTPPAGLESAYPTEFIDLDPETARLIVSDYEAEVGELTEKQKQKFFSLVEGARQDSLAQYDRMKREFLVVGGRPLLAGDFIGSLVRSSRITQKPVVIIGLSTDEAITYSLLSQRRLPKGKQPPPLIGINKGLSPSLEEMIADGEVETISDEVEMINPAALEPGKIYLIKRDVVEKDLPFPDSSVVIGMLYVLHHFPKARRLETVRQIMKKSVALHIFEGLSSENLLRMVIEVNYYLGSPHSGIDAGWTHICGGQTDESFRGFIAGLDQEEGWEIKSYPRLPSFPPLQSKVIPHQQLGIIWRRR